MDSNIELERMDSDIDRIRRLCRLGHINKLKKIIKNVPTNSFFLYDGTYWGCYYGNLDIINLIISKGVNYWNCGLAGSCRGGHIDMVNLMITKGASNMNWGFESACMGGHLNIVKLMISKGVDHLNHSIAISYDSKYWNIVHFLIESGTNFSSLNRSYISYLFNLPKFDRSICYLLEDIFHQGLIFCVQKYL
jgi:hypothetical protein